MYQRRNPVGISGEEKQEEIREEMQEAIEKAKAEKEAAEAKAEQVAAETTKQLLHSLVQKGLLSVKEAAEEMGVSEETFLNN